MRRLSLPRRLLYGAVTTMGLLLLVESAVRMLYRAELKAWASPPPAHHEGAPTLRGNPYLLFEFAPGIRHEQGVEVRINSLGLRGAEPVLPKPDGVRRILTTGDSSVFGFGVREEAVFSAVAAEQLGEEVEAINASIPGYSSYQSINLLRLRALKTDPVLIVIGNIWSDNNFDSFVDRDLLATTTGYERSPTARLQRILSGSAVYRVADWKLRVRARSKKIRTVSWQVGSQQHIGLRRVAINDYAKNLEILAGIADEVGAEIVFLLLANEEDVRTHVGGEKAWTPYREVMRQAAARHGAPIIEVPELFRDSGLSKDALFLDEMHPTVAGHRLMGEALVAVLTPWAAGTVINTKGDGSALPTYTDRFVQGSPQTGPVTGLQTASADGIRIQGMLKHTASTGEPITIEAHPAEGGGVLRSIVLDRPGQFVLQIGAPRKVVLMVRCGQEVLDLTDTVFALDQGPAGSIVIDLDAGALHQQ